jgi:type I restriction enzyme M protein
MALKKTQLYSSLWQTCDELRGGMDASKYKDYVLVVLFVKYVSDKFANVPFAEIKVPAGASLKDMVALKGRPDFNDANKLGSGKEMVERLTNFWGRGLMRATLVRGQMTRRSLGYA